MMNYILFLVFPILLFSCSNESEDKEEVKAKETKVENKITDACKLISQQDIKAVFSTENEVTNKEPISKTFPTCIYQWAAQKKGEKEIGGQVVTYDQENKVMIVLGSTTANDKQFERSTSVYKDAVEVDIAEKALWSDKMHQLTIMENGNLIHVNVEYFDAVDQQKAKAIELAKVLLPLL